MRALIKGKEKRIRHLQKGGCDLSAMAVVGADAGIDAVGYLHTR
jgi:hypothetical protein